MRAKRARGRQLGTALIGSPPSQDEGALYSRIYDCWAPIWSKISCRFGPRIHPITKEPQFHNGIDSPLTSGYKIIAPFPGYVITKDNPVGGLQLLLHSTAGDVTLGFAHLSKATDAKIVKRGDYLCSSGNSGRTTGPHLHFTFRVGKTLANPLDFLESLKSLCMSKATIDASIPKYIEA